VLLLLLLIGCLNPQPDPFPQNVDVETPDAPPQRSSGPNNVQFAPSTPATDSAAGTTATGSENNGNAAEQPPAPMAATPSLEGDAPADAGAAPDAGGALDAGVPANGF
jgi:hypothetical protein